MGFFLFEGFGFVPLTPLHLFGGRYCLGPNEFVNTPDYSGSMVMKFLGPFPLIFFSPPGFSEGRFPLKFFDGTLDVIGHSTASPF